MGGAVSAWIPERFCGLAVSTAGGAVRMQGVTEASVAVDSGGGAVHLGKVKAVAARVTTGGGALAGSLTAGRALSQLTGASNCSLALR